MIGREKLAAETLQVQTAAVILALVGSLLNHYAFSFQRFTLQIARQHASSITEIAALQLFMTPVSMGAVGWIAKAMFWAAAILLGISLSWWIAAAYVVADFVLFGALFPLFPLRDHFGALAMRQLEVSEREADSSLISSLKD